MIDLFKNIAIKSVLFFAFLASMNIVSAAPGDLVVDFESVPLFSEGNFMPGGEVAKWVKVSNNTSDSHAIIVEAINKINSGGLGDLLNLRIKENGSVLYNDSLSDFFNSGEVVLSNLSVNASTTYDFIVSFNAAADNAYQEKNLGFDLLVGFQGQGGEQADDGQFNVSSGSSSSGLGAIGGSGGPYQGLLISNDTSPLVLGNNVTINWDTSYYSTSQVIFGPESGAPYSLNIALPNFGYASSSPDFLDKVINHSVTIYNLPPDNYLYRVVSHASPPTISFEHSFSVSAVGSALTNANVDPALRSSIAPSKNLFSKARTNKNIVSAINNNEEIISEENIAYKDKSSDTEKINFKDIANLQEQKDSKESSINNTASVLSALEEISGSLKYIFLFLLLVGIVWMFLIRKREF